MTGGTCRIIICIVLAITGTVHAAYAASTNKETGKSIDLLRLEKTKICPGCDLKGLTLNRMDLKGADLQGADLRNARLHLANLAGADLRDSLLEGAIMVGADLAGADLRGAQLGENSLDGAYIAGAVFDQQRTDKTEELCGESIITGEAQSAVPQKEDGGGLVTVRSEEEVPIVKANFGVPSPKTLQPIQSATLHDITVEQGAEAM